MSQVAVNVANGDLGTLMAKMRVWLDERRFEPNTFEFGNARAIIYMEFKIEAEAAAFAEAFNGCRCSQVSSHHLPTSRT
jgi:hypothetical protein